MDSLIDTVWGPLSKRSDKEAIRELPAKGFGTLAPCVEIWSSAQYDGPLRRGDILMQRISGTRENLGRPFFVESSEPFIIRGA